MQKGKSEGRTTPSQEEIAEDALLSAILGKKRMSNMSAQHHRIVKRRFGMAYILCLFLTIFMKGASKL